MKAVGEVDKDITENNRNSDHSRVAWRGISERVRSGRAAQGGASWAGPRPCWGAAPGALFGALAEASAWSRVDKRARGQRRAAEAGRAGRDWRLW